MYLSTWKRVVLVRNDELVLAFGDDITSSAIGLLHVSCILTLLPR